MRAGMLETVDHVEVGCAVWERVPDEADYAPRGGTVVAIDTVAREGTGEAVRRFCVLTRDQRKQLQRVWIHADDVDVDTLQGPNTASLRHLWRTICREVGRRKGTALLDEGEYIRMAETLYSCSVRDFLPGPAGTCWPCGGLASMRCTSCMRALTASEIAGGLCSGCGQPVGKGVVSVPADDLTTRRGHKAQRAALDLLGALATGDDARATALTETLRQPFATAYILGSIAAGFLQEKCESTGVAAVDVIDDLARRMEQEI